MARIKIELPEQFAFQCRIPIRITDLNYGNHVGNDVFLALVHEARVQYLQSLGLSELSFAGCGLIMADAGMEYKAELFYGDVVIAEVAATDFSTVGFDLVYKLSAERNGKSLLAGKAKTGMICFDYDKRKPVAIPEKAAQLLGKPLS